jgi:hypothetical protein
MKSMVEECGCGFQGLVMEQNRAKVSLDPDSNAKSIKTNAGQLKLSSPSTSKGFTAENDTDARCDF